MLKPMNAVWIVVVGAVLFAGSAKAGSAPAREDAPPKPQATSVQGQDQAQDLVLHVGTYKGGAVSRLEPVNSVGTEADRLDQDKSGNLDARAQAQPTSRAATYATFGK
jgi:hypothetical protein